KVGGELEGPGLDRFAGVGIDAGVPAFAGHPVGDDLGAFDDDVGAGGGLVADHLVRAGAAAGGADHFAVNAFGDDDAFAGLEDLGGLVDGLEGAGLGAGAGVIGVGGLAVDVVGLGEGQRLFPHGKLGAIGERGA